MKLTIGKLAQQAEVTIATVRHYQRIGLLAEPEKPNHGFRHYSTEAITTIQFIKRAQKAGFTLKEIAELLSLDATHCDEIRKIAEQKCQNIDDKINELIVLRQFLTQLTTHCQQTKYSEHCAILDALSKNT
ncbi:MAG: MerR family transcriptional regulator [Methylococcales symbiont of Hymedesmia sp. n. MRB-2018]|nr:MAG: MerR family transcriptional regulator [Methylococcales symbiont of Hymedesmia sp. n. MRB-2018]